jgi:GNAT superfamily N-acetyltransferase
MASDETDPIHVIRPAVPGDIAALEAFTHAEAMDAERRGLDPADVRRGVAGAFETPPRARYWVAATSDGRLLASTSIVTEWSNFRGGDYWWIQSLYIVPEHRGQGLVDRLLQHLNDEARAAGALDLRLYGFNANERALRAYQRCGFTVAPYIVMTKPLRR